jgi:hypothetical protein
MPNWRKVIVSGSDAALNSLVVTTNVNAQSFTGSLFGTSSWANNVVSSSYALTASYALNAGVAGSTFPYTGSAQITGSLEITGSLLLTQSYISTVDYIDFTLTADPAHNEGRIHWIDDTKTLNVDTDVNNFYIELGHQNVVRVNNQNSFTLTKGTVVYINGQSGQRPTVATASFETDALSAATLGLVVQDINSGQNGYVVSSGIIRGINTNAFAPGTMLYLSSSGQFSSTIPESPLHEVRLGKTTTQATDGIIFIDVMNGYEIGELHDVLETNRQNGDLLIFDSGSRVYKNTKIFSGSYSISGSLNLSQGITGSLFGTSSYATQALSSSYAVTSSHALNVSIRTAGTSLYSHNPSTTNFSLTGGIFLGTIAGALSGNADNSIFMGSAAGYEAAGSSTSNFIGYQAGFFAQDSNYSNFIGNQAGQYSSLATSSNFIGNQAGQYSGANNSNFFGTLAGAEVSNSHYSNFIGYFAGRGNNLGRNNILIGTNIGLPSGSRDRINIAGLIYGTGSYFNTSGAVFSGSANGRIGINQPNPQKEFDVSGSIRISQLSTSLTAPVTSGTTKMVISDANGDLSFTDIPAGGSITIADEGTSQGTATFLNFTGEGVTATVTSNTASISITGGGSAFPYTGSAQITGSLGITGSLAISSSLFQYADNTDVDIGTEVVLSIQTGSYRSAFFDYVISSGSNARAGTVMSVWGSSSIDFTETSTNDIGTTTDVTLSTILSGSFVQLRATTLSNNWTVKSLVRML